MSAPLPLFLRLASVEAREDRVHPARMPDGDALVEALHDAAGPRPRETLVVFSGGPDWAGRYRALGHRVRSLPLRGPQPPPLPVRDAALDLLHVHGLAERLAHPGAELAEWLRVLSPGGLLLISGEAPAAAGARSRNGRVFAHGLHAAEAAALLETAGLRGVGSRTLRHGGAATARAWWARLRPRKGGALYFAWGRVA